ncbi:unnamed protein product [Lupinus luteus]|uniref:Uncharacterized protein n=1 Tax=Lupinus luteus TaxID=3873 RepID=A0AAV1XA13_LUPLU
MPSVEVSIFFAFKSYCTFFLSSSFHEVFGFISLILLITVNGTYGPSSIAFHISKSCDSMKILILIFQKS